MMKKTKKLISLCIIAILLTGCVQYNLTIDFRDGESAILTSELYINENDLKKSQITIKDIKKQITSNDDIFAKWSIKESSQTIDHEKYQGLIIQAPESVNEEIAKNFSHYEKKDITTYELNLDIQKSGLDLSELTHYQSTLSTLKNNQAQFVLTIKMPGQVTSSSIGHIDHHIVTIDLYEYLMSGHVPPISIISQEESIDDDFYAYFIMGLVFIVIIIFIYYLMKKKRKKDI